MSHSPQTTPDEETVKTPSQKQTETWAPSYHTKAKELKLPRPTRLEK